jgi:hypothetical protein
MEGFNTQLLFPIACAIASGMFCSCLMDKKKFDYLVSVIVGVIVGGFMFYILPSFTKWSGII